MMMDQRENMNLKRYTIYSIGLHALIILLMVLGMPHFSKKPSLSPPVVSVEVVKIGPKTRIPLKAMEPKPKPTDEKPKSTPKTPPKSQPEPPKISESKPDVVQIPNKKEQVKPLKPVVKKIPEKIKEHETPKSKKQVDKKIKKAKSQEDDFMSVLNSLEKMPVPQEEESKDSKVKRSKATGGDITDTLTVSELDALRTQLSKCWSLPSGARDAEGLVVEIKVTMNPDATVQQTKIVEESRMSKDPFFQTAAESARRALLDPNCSPLILPKDKYHEWREFRITFNPKEMF